LWRVYSMNVFKISNVSISNNLSLIIKPLIVVFAIHLFVLFLPVHSFAASSVSGKVTNSSGTGIAGILVSATNTTSGAYYSGGSTQSDGSYTIVALPTGSYKLQFQANTTGYITQWYNNKTSSTLADVVTVTAESAISGINATLAMGGTITGKVNNTSGTGIANISVNATANGGSINSAVSTKSDGSYTIVGLPTGIYKVQFQGASGYVSQWYNNKKSSELADAVAVTAGATTSGINATLIIGGTITGKVTNSSGTGIYPAFISARDVASSTYSTGTISQSDGSYSIIGLPSGSYKLDFSGSNGYLLQYYNNKTSPALADAVTITEGSTISGINATLAMGGTITGKVINSSGIGIASVSVRATDSSGVFSSTAGTKTDGSYTIIGLPSGSYTIDFFAGDMGYLGQYFNNKTSSTLADVVNVNAGATVSGINATLSVGGTITGKVTNTSGTGIAGVMMLLLNEGGIMGTYYTQSDGSYSISGLPTGGYRLQFQNYTSGYINQWYNNKTSSTLADVVNVTAGATTNGINAILVLGGTITGKITNSSGIGIAGVSVKATDSGDGTEYPYISTTTQSDGNYSIIGLPTGNFKLQFQANTTGYINQWYNSKTSSTLADTITVTAGATINGINATLAMGGTITGKVTNSSGTGIIGVTVYVPDEAGGCGYYCSGGYGYNAVSQSDGSYTITGLPTGSYKLQFQGNITGYAAQWYSNKISSAVADTISVTAGSISSGIDATLTSGGSISGRVANEHGVGLRWAYVEVYDLSGYKVSSASTDDQGYYQAIGLPNGMVKVHFDGGSAGSFSGQWYSNKGQFNTADTISVTVPEEVPNINAVFGVGPDIIATPVIVNFENCIINSTASKTIFIFNDGNVNLSLGTIGLAGQNAAEFSFNDDWCSGKTLPPYGSCSFKIKYNPTTVGIKNANVVIPSNDPDTAELNISLSGTGTSIDPVLNTIIIGNGAGSVHSSPDTGISCTKGSSNGCSKQFSIGTLVKLTANPEVNSSIFGGWSNACNSDPCEISVDTDKTAVATFTLAPKIKLDLAASTGYDELPVAYSYSVSTIYALIGLFSGDWLLGNSKDIIFKGGYLADYGPTRNGFTTLNGKLTIKSGSLRVDRLVVREVAGTTPP
jgi:cytochrome oxidase assembly protein ShyY1